MNNKIIKYCLSILFVFGVFFLTNSCFCATQKVYFEKPDSWTGDKVYANLSDSTGNSTLTANPGYEISKQLSKFKFDNVYTLNGDLYMFTIADGTSDTLNKITFLNGNDTTSITNSTIATNYESNKLYEISGGTGMNQTAVISKDFDINLATSIQRFSLQLKNKNTNLEIIEKLEPIVQKIQKTLANIDSYDIFEGLVKPLDDINNQLKKDETSISDLTNKIQEGKDTIKDGGYTADSTAKLEDDIKKAEDMIKDKDYFTNDQIKDMTNTLDQDINALVPDTTELEKLLEEAKKVDQSKYTDETSKLLADAISNTESQLNDKDSLTIDKINDLTKALKDSMNGLKEKTVLVENTNPSTGDILYIVIPVLIVALLAIGFTIVYSKKKKQNEIK